MYALVHVSIPISEILFIQLASVYSDEQVQRYNRKSQEAKSAQGRNLFISFQVLAVRY